MLISQTAQLLSCIFVNGYHPFQNAYNLLSHAITSMTNDYLPSHSLLFTTTLSFCIPFQNYLIHLFHCRPSIYHHHITFLSEPLSLLSLTVHCITITLIHLVNNSTNINKMGEKTTSYLKTIEHHKKTTYDNYLGQAQNCDRVKPYFRVILVF